MNVDNRVRCPWTGSDPLYIAYHDTEWGVPVHDDGKWFEMLILEGFQAGLSWLTVLRKREHFRQAFHQWNPERIAAYTPEDMTRLMNNPLIIRNRLKITAAITNARAFLNVQDEFESFDNYMWRFTDGRILISAPRPPHPGRSSHGIP